MKKAFLLTESSVYTDRNGGVVARGGGEMSFHILAKALLKLGIKPFVFAIREYPDQLEHEEIDGVEYERFPVKSRVSPGLFRFLGRAVALSRDFDYVFLNQFTPHLILSRLGKQKKVAVVHDVYGSVGFWIKQYGLFKGMVGYFVEKMQLKYDGKFADTIMCVSEYGKQRVIEALGTSIERKVIVNSWPIDLSEFEKCSDKDDYVLFVGRFIDYKNPEHALYALNKIRSVYPNFRLVMVASRVEDKVLRRVEKLRDDLGFGGADVEIKFDCDDTEVRDLFAHAKLFLHPSYVEGLGIVCLEAIASGTPVVAYDLPAYEWMLVDGVNSRIVSCGCVDDFGGACLEVLGGYAGFFDRCEVPAKFSESRFSERLTAL